MSAAREGVVYLVGAGPGDRGLMTERSLELIATADVIFHDRLIPAGALEGADPEAELVYVGKEPGAPAMEQSQIESLMVERARRGHSVVRLKGGDPFVFGRGGEEAEALRDAGVRFEVVPGVTAGVGASAYAGIPVTHRDDASAVAFVTGHEDPAKPETAINWDALAAFPGTLVFYMGVKRLPEIAERLIASGRAATEPAAVVERGTTPAQRVVEAPLDEIAAEAERAGISPPALTIVGPVAARRERIAWLQERPLYGLRVVVTRARAQASELASTLGDLGADVIELPAIRTESLCGSDEVAAAVARIHEYTLICLTSANAVRELCTAMVAQGRDARALGGVTVAAIGPATAEALGELGILPDLIGERSVGEGLVEALGDVDVEGARVLVARAAKARDVLPDALRARGAEVDVVALYETVAEEPDPDSLAAALEADYVTFTSSSTVKNFLAASGGAMPDNARIVSIGPITSQAVRDAGFEVDAEADEHDVEGLVEALLADAARPAK